LNFDIAFVNPENFTSFPPVAVPVFQIAGTNNETNMVYWHISCCRSAPENVKASNSEYILPWALIVSLYTAILHAYTGCWLLFGSGAEI
jgi:hypothetical protein